MGKTINENYEKLLSKVKGHAYRYYIEDDPIITDYEYDMMLRDLQKMEEELFGDYQNGSPTTQVGAIEEWRQYK